MNVEVNEFMSNFLQEHVDSSECAEKVYLCQLACRWLGLTDQTVSRHQAKVALWRAQIEYEIKLDEGSVNTGKTSSGALMRCHDVHASRVVPLVTMNEVL